MYQPTNPLAFLVDTLIHLYTLALLLRFLLQLVRANFYNPVSQALVTVTNPLLRPLRAVIPGFRGVDFAAVVAMFALQVLAIWLVALIGGVSAPFTWIALTAVYRLLDLVLLTFIVTILIQVVISWVNPGAANPAVSLLWQLNAPVMRPFRRLVPPIGGLDLSALFTLIALQFCRQLLRWLF